MMNLLIATLLLAAAPPTPGKPVPARPAPASPAAGRPLTGNWAGGGFAMREAPTGTIVQGPCASGLIAGPVLVDRNGNFTATGYYNPYSAGYRLSDLAPRDKIAYFNGKVSGRTLDLKVRPQGKPELHYLLKRDARAKFAKCS